jgi:hypothetical protein
MTKIEIDQVTYDFLQSKAIAFVETPGDTLKRLLGLAKSVMLKSTEEVFSVKANSINTNKFMVKKKSKTNLLELINSGLLSNNQVLVFQDYRGTSHPKYKVILTNNSLIWENKRYSMSDLAQILLKQLGYESNSVRGPLFWTNGKGKTVAELWETYLSTK